VSASHSFLAHRTWISTYIRTQYRYCMQAFTLLPLESPAWYPYAFRTRRGKVRCDALMSYILSLLAYAKGPDPRWWSQRHTIHCTRIRDTRSKVWVPVGMLILNRFVQNNVISPWKRRFSLIFFRHMVSSQCARPIAKACSCALLIVP
jgi:hypothetical protein